MDKIGKLVMSLVYSVSGAIYVGFVSLTLITWFIPFVFNYTPLNIPILIGIRTLIKLTFGKTLKTEDVKNTKEPSNLDNFLGWGLNGILVPSIALGMGFITKQFV